MSWKISLALRGRALIGDLASAGVIFLCLGVLNHHNLLNGYPVAMDLSEHGGKLVAVEPSCPRALGEPPTGV